MVQLFLTIFMIVTYALAAAILTYVSICSIEDSKDQQQFETIAKSIEEQNEDGDTDTTNKVYDLMLKNKDCIGLVKGCGYGCQLSGYVNQAKSRVLLASRF